MPTLGEISAFETASTPTWGDFDRDVAEFLQRQGLSYFSFVRLQQPNQRPVSDTLLFHASYEPQWVERYGERRYDQVDPVCQLGRQARSPFRWGSKQFLSAFPKQQKRVFWEARDYNIRYGVSIPVMGLGGRISLVSFTSEDNAALGDVIREHGSRLHVAAHQICDHLEPNDHLESVEDSPLTARERECLIWVSQGLTSEEIADRVFVSVSTVNYHLGNVVRKMSARNRHHAALLALAKGLI